MTLNHHSVLNPIHSGAPSLTLDTVSTQLGGEKINAVEISASSIGSSSPIGVSQIRELALLEAGGEPHQTGTLLEIPDSGGQQRHRVVKERSAIEKPIQPQSATAEWNRAGVGIVTQLFQDRDAIGVGTKKMADRSVGTHGRRVPQCECYPFTSIVMSI